MRLAVFSHKPCWRDQKSPSGYATDGGFPRQIEALSQLFSETRLVVPVAPGVGASGTSSLQGVNLSVKSLSYLNQRGLVRRLAFPIWLITNLPEMTRWIRWSDAVHSPIPGDVGMLGILLALIFRKPLYVRYCGRWGYGQRSTHRFAHWMLSHIAGGKNVVLATGGEKNEPSQKNPAIHWIFATSLWSREIEQLSEMGRRRVQSNHFRIATVARLEPGKNIDALIRAVKELVEEEPATILDVVGSGSELKALISLSETLSLTGSVKFHGRLAREKVLEVLLNAYVFCLPTDSEGFPKAVHEAMACGLPCITTPVSVLETLIGDHAGILLKDPNPETIAMALRRVRDDPLKRKRLGEGASIVARRFSLEVWREEIARHLEQAWGPLNHEAAV